MAASRGEVTQLLDAATRGEAADVDRLFPLIYDELHAIAEHYLRRERGGHTLQPTALVHEAYLKLVDQRHAKVESRRHFLALAATAMRRVLVNHAEARAAQKRGGGARRVPLTDVTGDGFDRALDILALEEALVALEGLDPRKVHVVEMRFFAGMTNDEAATALGVSTATIKRDWDFAKVWLYGRIFDGEDT